MNKPNEPVETMTQGAETMCAHEYPPRRRTCGECRDSSIHMTDHDFVDPAPPAPEVKEEAGEMTLKCCPFCGASVRVERVGRSDDEGGYFAIECGTHRSISDGSAEIVALVHASTPEEAIAAWNRRASAPIPEPSEPQTFEEWVAKLDHRHENGHCFSIGRSDAECYWLAGRRSRCTTAS